MSEKLPKNAAKKPAKFVNSSSKVIDDMSSDGFEFHSSYANVITNRDGSREVGFIMQLHKSDRIGNVNIGSRCRY